MIMRPYLTHGFVPSERGGDRRAGEEIARPDGNNVGGPSHATYHGLTVPRRARVIPPIIKLLSCGWHPRATRGYTRHCPLTLSPPLPLPHAPPCSSLFSPSFFLPPLFLRSCLPTPSIRSIRLSLSSPPILARRRSADQMLRTFAAKDRSFLVVSGSFQID